MKELSLYTLDIATNSIRAHAQLIRIDILEDDEQIVVRISDDGCGMDKELLGRVTDPFSTTRTTRRVGLGIPFFKMQAELTGGTFSISSRSEKEYADHGTVTQASFLKASIDCVPLGNMVETICTLIHGMGEIDLIFTHTMNSGEVKISTSELREVLGGDVPLSEPEVIAWIREYLEDAYASANLT
jgi:signal transduction histidine kinase